MNTPEFWINKLHNKNHIIMTEEEINRFNKKIRENCDSIYYFEENKQVITKKELEQYILEYSFPKDISYDYDGNKVENSFFEDVKENINLSSIKELNGIRYGLTLKKTSIRRFPTDIGLYKSISNNRLDRFQETGCGPFEAVAILHESKDQKWLFVQTYNYRGWVKKKDLVIDANKKNVFEYIKEKTFLVVTGNTIDFNNHKIIMGTRVPLVRELNKTFGVKIPVNSNNGDLGFDIIAIDKTNDVKVGYLKLSRENIINQAFKMLGDDYDWGDKYYGRDCSSFILSIYKTFGINLPRNADQQERVHGKIFELNLEDNQETRLKIMNKVKAGSAIYMPGHVMMYLGKNENKHYMIHAYGEKGEINQGKVVPVPVYKVEVTPILTLTSRGNTYLDEFTRIIDFSL